jgi:hypothetical protein
MAEIPSDAWIRDYVHTISKINEIKTNEELKKVIRWGYDYFLQVMKTFHDSKDEIQSLAILWCLGTYIHDQFSTYPYLFINAPRQSGKTRLLNLISCFSNNGRVENDISEAVLFRTPPNTTILIDEFEGISSKDKGTLRQLLNSAYKRGVVVRRAKKVKSLKSEDYVLEEYNLYFAVAIANIWGIENVLADRCIPLVIEKSNDPTKTLLLETFDSNSEIKMVKEAISVALCKFALQYQSNMIQEEWNKFCTSTTHITPHTYISSIYTTYTTLFNKIYKSGLNSRQLELFFPIFIIADIVGEDILDKIIITARQLFEEKKIDDVIDNSDISLLDYISSLEDVGREWVAIKTITEGFKAFMEENDEKRKKDSWISNEWIGRALKRQTLVIKRRRLGRGVEVMLNYQKAKEKIKFFKLEDKSKFEECKQCGLKGAEYDEDGICDVCKMPQVDELNVSEEVVK